MSGSKIQLVLKNISLFGCISFFSFNLWAGKSLPKIGDSLPGFQFRLEKPKVGVVDMTRLNSRYSLLDFWAVWCDFCVKEMPNLHSVYEQYQQHGLEIYSFSLDKNSQDVARFRNLWPMPWQHVYLPGGFKHPFSRAIPITGLPTIFLLDSQGQIVASEVELRGENLSKTLERLMAEENH